MFFGRSKRKEPEKASIIDFNPVDRIAFQATKPIYTNINYELRYSPNGIFETHSPVLWKDEQNYRKSIGRCHVSPNSDFIAIYQQETLFILTKEGKVLDTIKKISNASSKKFDVSSLQWTSDSACFYLLYYEVYSTDFNKRDKNRSILFRYIIVERKLEKFVEFNCEISSFHYHLSKDSRSIYFKPLSSYCYYELNIDEGKAPFDIKIQSVTGDANRLYFYTMLSNGKTLKAVSKIESEFDKLFINFSAYSFEQGSAQVESHDLKYIMYCNAKGLYTSNDYQISKVFSIQENEEDRDFKRLPNINLNGAYFLPGNRYFIFSPSSKEYEGYLLIDVATNQYTKLPYHKLDCYFSVTTEDCHQLRYDFRIEPNWDNSNFSSSGIGWKDGKAIFIELPLPQPNLRDALKAFI